MSMPPENAQSQGKQWKLVLLKVTRKFPNGTFREAERIPDAGTVHLTGGEEFITAYVPAEMLDPEQVNKSE